MCSFAKNFPIIVLASLILFGCGPPRCVPSLIHPHPSGKPFEECSINLNFYKPVQQRPGQDPNIALAVAASGGGYRAANFVTGALLGLEELKNSNSPSRNALSDVDYFSSVSGGGFAVGAYISTLHDYSHFAGSAGGYSFAAAVAPTNSRCPCGQKPPADQKNDPCVRRHLQGLYKDFIADFLRTLLPWNHLGFDNRNLRFEQAIDDDTLGYRWREEKLKSLRDPNSGRNATLTLADVFIPAGDSNEVLLPYWFANAAVYENAVIFPYSPEHLWLYKVTGYYYRTKEYKFTASDQSHEQFISDMPLSSGVASSANFPLAMPPLRFTSEMDGNNHYFYLLDGGVADNLGVITATRLLIDETADSVRRKVLIVIDSYQGNLTPFEKAEDPPAGIATAARIMETGLDSWRARYREITDKLCEQNNITPVYLSFDDLVEVDFNDLYPFGLTEQDKQDLCANKPKNCPRATPFYLLRSISMTAPVFWGKHGLEYRIPDSQQNLLIAAGRCAVNKKKDQILSALGWR